ncbi:MAG: hypothetical protein ACLS3S_07495 [Streptococcus salivarius]
MRPYRLSNTNGFNLPGAMGMPLHGGSIARANGYRVDMNPAVGSIAGFQRCQQSWIYGTCCLGEVNGDR